MLKKLELSSSQHQGWDKYCDERAIVEARLSAQEKRYLTDCLMELGGRLNEPWQYDAPTRTFYLQVKDEDGPRADERTIQESLSDAARV